MTAAEPTLHRKNSDVPTQRAPVTKHTPNQETISAHEAAQSEGQLTTRNRLLAKQAYEAGLEPDSRLTGKPFLGKDGQIVKKPTQYTKELGDEIISRVSNGESDSGIAYDAHMPSVNSIRLWRNGESSAPSSWCSDYARARIDQASAMAYEIVSLADLTDERVTQNAKDAVANLPDDATQAQIRRAHFYARSRSIEATKLQIDARKWITSRLNPAQWSERALVDVNVNTNAPAIDYSQLTTEQLEQIAQLQAQLTASAVGSGEAVDVTPTPQLEASTKKDKPWTR